MRRQTGKPGFAFPRVRFAYLHVSLAAFVLTHAAFSQQPPPAYHAHLARAQELLDKEKFSEGVSALHAALALWPETRGAYYQLGYALFQLGRATEAEAAFQKELTFPPPDAFSLYFLGRLRSDANRRKEALAFFERSLAAGEILDVRQRIGSTYLALGQIPAAIRFLEGSARANAHDGGLQYLLGRAYKQEGMAAKAAAAFQAAARAKQKASGEAQALLKLRQALAQSDRMAAAHLGRELEGSTDPEVLLGAATALGRAGAHGDAIPLLQKAIAIRPRLPDGHYNLARAYLATSQPDAAVVELESAIALKPDFYEALVLRGTMLATGGDSEAAIKYLRAAVILPPATPRLMTMLGLQYFGRSYFGDAAEVLEKAARLDPENVDARFLLIQAHYRNLNYEQALAEARDAAAAFPSNALAQYHFGAQLNNMGRIEEAARYLESALEKEPVLLEARVMLGEVRLKAGRSEDAAAEFRRALEINPGWMDAHAGLGKALVQLKRFAEAAAAMEEAIRIDATLPAPHLYLSQAYRALGRLDEAKREVEIFGRLNEQRAKARDADVQRKYIGPTGG
jgi:tetratricopeptide (TPR) repeat protein